MAEEYPHDYLFRLEEANLEKDAGDGMVAVETYQGLIEMAKRAGYYPNAHLELAYFGLGDSLRGTKEIQRCGGGVSRRRRSGDDEPGTEAAVPAGGREDV